MPDRSRTYLQGLDPADWSACLVGLGGGLLAWGLLEHFFRLFDPMPTTWRVVIGASFLALAVGLRIPHRLATWLAAKTWRRLGGRAPALSPYASFLPTEKDLPLHRMVLAGLAVLCGAVIIGSLGLIRLAQMAHEYLLERFLWGSAESGWLLGIECALATAVVFPVFVPVGLTWSCVHHLACPVMGWRVRPLAGLCAGLALANGVALLTWGGAVPVNPDLFLLAGSLPFFLLSIVTTRSTPPNVSKAPPERGEGLSPASLEGRRRVHRHTSNLSFNDSKAMRYSSVPRLRARGAALITAAVIILFCCAVASAALWWRVFGILAARTYHGGAMALATWSLGFASAAAIYSVRRGERTYSIGALGSAYASAGVATALAAGLLGLLGLWGHRVAGHTAGGALLSACIAGVSAFALGRAAVYGLNAALTRTSHQSEVGSVLLSRMMLAGAGVVIVALTPLIVAVGTYAALVAVSLVLVGVGGALIIHEPTYLRQTRRLRLALIFGSIAFMSLVLPLAGSGWLVTRPWKRIRLDEHAWLTQSTWAVRGDIRRLSEPAAHGGGGEHALGLSSASVSGQTPTVADWSAASGALHVALVGTPPAALEKGIADAGFRCDRRLFDPSVLSGGRLDSPSNAPWPKATREPATRFLRRAPQRYDVIVIGLSDTAPPTWTPAIRIGLVERALHRLRIDGVILLAAPLAQWARADLVEFLDAVRTAGCARFSWSTISHGNESTLWLAFGKDAHWRTRWIPRLPWVDRDAEELTAALTQADLRALHTSDGTISSRLSPPER